MVKRISGNFLFRDAFLFEFIISGRLKLTQVRESTYSPDEMEERWVRERGTEGRETVERGCENRENGKFNGLGRMEETTEHSTLPLNFRCDPSFFDSAHGAMRDLFSNPFTIQLPSVSCASRSFLCRWRAKCLMDNLSWFYFFFF